MLSRDHRLKLCEILYRLRLQRKVTLEERIWASKLISVNNHARGLSERILGGILEG